MLGLIYRHVQRADIGLMGFSRVAEAAVNQPKATGDQQHEGHKFLCVHKVNYAMRGRRAFLYGSAQSRRGQFGAPAGYSALVARLDESRSRSVS